MSLNIIDLSHGKFASSTAPRGSVRALRHNRGADKSLAQPTSRCIFFDGEYILFDASLVSTNIPPIVIINRIYEHKNLLSL